MRSRSINKTVVLPLVAAVAAIATPSAARAALVSAGFDLFATVSPGTTFQGFEFEGVPLGTFDFGFGAVSVGDTSTIVERQADAIFPLGPGTAAPIRIEMVALQLRSVVPIDLGAGLDFYFITLDSFGASTGTMTITFSDADPGNFGTFDSTIDVDFDVRIGALNGPIVFSGLLPLSSANGPWDRTPPVDAVLTPGVNRFLLGPGNINGDFWPDDFEESHPDGTTHSVTSAVPAPARLALLGLAGLMGTRRRRR